MPHKQMLAESFTSNLELLKTELADFSDADMMCRPVPGANHATWQVGHLISAEASLLNVASAGAAPALPEGFERKFGHETTSCNDPAALAGKQELLELFTRVRQATVEWVRKTRLPELDKPLPESVPARLRQMCPTVGHVAMLIIGHTTMHVGQIQVIRRALGKPVLF